MTQRDSMKPPGPADVDDPPDFIEANAPEDALNDTDPERSIVDRQNPDAGIKQEVSEPDTTRRRSPY
ncbi:MAG TPA: hypothetical protein VGE69_00565 [Pseudomonadales bacterium]